MVPRRASTSPGTRPAPHACSQARPRRRPTPSRPKRPATRRPRSGPWFCSRPVRRTRISSPRPMKGAETPPDLLVPYSLLSCHRRPRPHPPNPFRGSPNHLPPEERRTGSSARSQSRCRARAWTGMQTRKSRPSELPLPMQSGSSEPERQNSAYTAGVGRIVGYELEDGTIVKGGDCCERPWECHRPQCWHPPAKPWWMGRERPTPTARRLRGLRRE
jgi:hypothetical protein